MILQDLTIEMMEDAKKLLRENYDQARRNLPILPSDICFPPLAPLFKNGLGAAAYEDGKMLGFLSGFGP